MTAFWNMAPCSHVEVGRRFRGANCHQYHHRPDYRCSTHLWNVGSFQRTTTRHIEEGRHLQHYNYLNAIHDCEYNVTCMPRPVAEIAAGVNQHL